MARILLAVDGSECAVRATRKLIDTVPLFDRAPAIDLVTVHLPVHRFPHMGLVISDDMLRKYYEDESEANLRASKALLDTSGIQYVTHSLVGTIAQSIVDQAKAEQCDFIYMGTRGNGALAAMLLGSVVTKVLHITPIPVVVVP